MNVTDLAVLLATTARGIALAIRGCLSTPPSVRECACGVAFLLLGLGYYMRITAAKWALGTWSLKDLYSLSGQLLPCLWMSGHRHGDVQWTCLLDALIVALLLVAGLATRVPEWVRKACGFTAPCHGSQEQCLFEEPRES